MVNFSLLSNPGAIAGVVTDAMTTAPISGARLEVFQGATFIVSMLTDDNGDYAITGLAPGNYVVVAGSPGYQTAFSAFAVVASSTTMADFALNSPAGTIAGTITEAGTGNPIEGVHVVVADGTVVVGFGLSDNNGAYSIPDLAPGSYRVTVGKRTFVIAWAVADVALNATTIVNFSLRSIFSISLCEKCMLLAQGLL